MVMAAMLGRQRGLGGTLIAGLWLVCLPAALRWLRPDMPDLALPALVLGGLVLLDRGRPRPLRAHG
jgi:hypothetical protein